MDHLPWQALGTITTYLIPGKAPFLISRKVLEGMEATLNLGKMTLTSRKHGMHQWPLAQASNAHLLLPLVPAVEGNRSEVLEADCMLGSLEPPAKPLGGEIGR